jgi:hypothetical protein
MESFTQRQNATVRVFFTREPKAVVHRVCIRSKMDRHFISRLYTIFKKG